MLFGINKKALFIILVIVLKVVIILLVNDQLALNYDEFDAYNIASNIVKGKGQVIFNDICNCNLPTARRGAFNILLYQYLIIWGISIATFVVFYYVLYFILFVISIICFYKICIYYLQSIKLSQVAAVIYILYPSSLIYIGSSVFYENIAICSLVIFFYYFIVNYSFNLYKLMPLLVVSLLSLLLRPHTMPIFMVLSVIGILVNLRISKWKLVSLIGFIGLVLLCNYGLVQRNENLVGHKITSSQLGFEILQGHNPFARGSWMSFNYQTDTSHPIYLLVKKEAPNVILTDEFVQSETRKQLGIKWILDHPKDEIVLTCRKIAIFLLPQNFESMNTSTWYNPINLLVHLFFLGFIGYVIIKKKFNINNILLIIPFVICLLLSIVFFVGYRWRYYCEPFMIIGAMFMIRELMNKKYEIKGFK